jgi:hypothetical protein
MPDGIRPRSSTLAWIILRLDLTGISSFQIGESPVVYPLYGSLCNKSDMAIGHIGLIEDT